MTANRITKFYATLTPRERLPLIQAAALRDDEADRQRLVSSAPSMNWKLPDYYGTSNALRQVATAHTLTQLELIGVYWHLYTMLIAGLDRETDDDGLSEVREQTRTMVTYKFHTNAKAWLEFCNELQVDPIASCLGLVSDPVQHVSAALEPQNPLSESEMREAFPNVELTNVAQVLEWYRTLFEYHEKKWM